MRRISPREFKRLFKHGCSGSVGDNISNEDFKKYFSELIASGETSDDEYTDFINQFDADSVPSTPFDYLDAPISDDEILRAKKKLGSNKASSIDRRVDWFSWRDEKNLSSEKKLKFNTKNSGLSY